MRPWRTRDVDYDDLGNTLDEMNDWHAWMREHIPECAEQEFDNLSGGLMAGIYSVCCELADKKEED